MTGPDIDSPSNPRIKAWRALRDRSERERTGWFLVEGERETLRAIGHLRPVEIIVREDRSDLDLPDAVRVSERAFARISARQHPDGVAAIVETPSLDLDDLPDDGRVALVADGVEKPGNVGAMVRTADAFGASFIGASLATDLVNPNVVRSAQGSLFACRLAAAPRSEVIPWCMRHGPIVVASPDADRSLWDMDLSGPVSIVVGSEHLGVDPAWLEVGSAATIPTSGTADSLNASVAAAIFLAEASRQRSG